MFSSRVFKLAGLKYLHFIIIKTDSTLGSKTMGPESIKSCRFLSISKDEPEREYRLGQDIDNCVCNNFSVNRPVASALSDTPNNKVQDPDNKRIASNGGIELASGSITLSLNGTTTGNDQLIGNNQEGKKGKNEPSPFGGATVASVAYGSIRRGKESGECKSNVCEDDDENVRSADASKEGQAEDNKWEGQCRVDRVSPEHLSEDVLGCIWDMIVYLANYEVDKGRSSTGCLCIVGDSGDGSDERHQDVEEALLLVGESAEARERQRKKMFRNIPLEFAMQGKQG